MKTRNGGVYVILRGIITYYYYGTTFDVKDVADLLRITQRRALQILTELEEEGLIQSFNIPGTKKKMYMVKRLDESLVHIVRRIAETAKALGLIE